MRGAQASAAAVNAAAAGATIPIFDFIVVLSLWCHEPRWEISVCGQTYSNRPRSWPMSQQIGDISDYRYGATG